jgi:homoserine kinase
LAKALNAFLTNLLDDSLTFTTAMSREPGREHERAELGFRSRGRYRGIPLISGLGSEGAQCAAGIEMALQVESVVDGGMGGEKALSGSW